MKKLFISQPMRGKTDEEILTERNNAIKKAEELIGEKVEVLETFFNFPDGANPLTYLAKSLEFLAQADAALFIGDWKNYRGCRIEHLCATEYGINVIEEQSFWSRHKCRDQNKRRSVNMEIKFRAFDKTTNTMVPIVGIRDFKLKDVYAIWFVGFGEEVLYCEIKKENIEIIQSTGIRDINGVEIYTGDIIKHYNCGLSPSSYEVDKIVFDQDRAAFRKQDSDGKLWNIGKNCEYEVIGNIYQNKELAERYKLL